MHRANPTRTAAVMAGVLASGIWAGAQVRRPAAQPLVDIRTSTDVAWLERIAASASFARDLRGPRDRATVAPKTLRTTAFERLGAIGTPAALAAIARIERELAAMPLTPATVPLGASPTVAWHIADPDEDEEPIAAAAPRDDVTCAVVAATLLGGTDLFLISTRTPADRASWSRPKLIAPTPRAFEIAAAALAWAGPRTLVLRAAGGTVQIALDDVERDSDGDGWTDLEEARIGTNPHAADSDDDGLPDGRDVCPLYARPAGADDAAMILQAAIFGAFAMTGSRELLYVTPQTPRLHLAGYGGPVIFDRPIPKSGDGAGATYVSWRITSRTANDAIVELTDWEGVLAAGGQDVTLKRIAGRWVVVAIRSTWVS